MRDNEILLPVCSLDYRNSSSERWEIGAHIFTKTICPSWDSTDETFWVLRGMSQCGQKVCHPSIVGPCQVRWLVGRFMWVISGVPSISPSKWRAICYLCILQGHHGNGRPKHTRSRGRWEETQWLHGAIKWHHRTELRIDGSCTWYVGHRGQHDGCTQYIDHLGTFAGLNLHLTYTSPTSWTAEWNCLYCWHKNTWLPFTLHGEGGKEFKSAHDSNLQVQFKIRFKTSLMVFTAFLVIS